LLAARKSGDSNPRATVDLTLVEAEERVYINNQVAAPITPNGLVILRKLIQRPRHRWRYDKLLDPPFNYKPNTVGHEKRYQDYVRDTVRTLPREIRRLLDPGHGGHHGGRCFLPHVKARIVSA